MEDIQKVLSIGRYTIRIGDNYRETITVADLGLTADDFYDQALKTGKIEK
jgi:hypothetical protein